MIDENIEGAGEEFRELEKSIPDTKVAPAHGIAAIALSMALKYHDMQMIPDGLTYQQYKMEGRNIRTIGLADVFDTAIRIEAHLLGASARIAQIVVDAIAAPEEAEGPEEVEEQVRSEPQASGAS
jgi:hypothetical protein